MAHLFRRAIHNRRRLRRRPPTATHRRHSILKVVNDAASAHHASSDPFLVVRSMRSTFRWFGGTGESHDVTRKTPYPALSTRDAYKFKFPGWPDAGCSWWSIVTSMVPRRGRRFEGLTGYPPCACNFGQLQAADLWCCKQLFRPGVHMQDPLHSTTHFRRPYSTIQKSRFNFNP